VSAPAFRPSTLQAQLLRALAVLGPQRTGDGVRCLRRANVASLEARGYVRVWADNHGIRRVDITDEGRALL
jgi:DNA-binding MarR family transcriptional regulator